MASPGLQPLGLPGSESGHLALIWSPFLSNLVPVPPSPSLSFQVPNWEMEKQRQHRRRAVIAQHSLVWVKGSPVSECCPSWASLLIMYLFSLSPEH